MAQHGAIVFLADKLPEQAQEVSNSITKSGGQVTATKLDVSSESDWYDATQQIANKSRVFMPYIGFPDYVNRCNEMFASGFHGFKFS